MLQNLHEDMVFTDCWEMIVYCAWVITKVFSHIERKCEILGANKQFFFFAEPKQFLLMFIKNGVRFASNE